MKIQKRILAITLALLLVLSLSACGGKKTSVVGKWNLTGGTALDAVLGEELGDIDLISLGLVLSFDFQKDGKAQLSMKLLGEENAMDGTWSVDGDKITITMEDEPQTFGWKLDGDKLTLTSTDEAVQGDLTFEKAK